MIALIALVLLIALKVTALHWGLSKYLTAEDTCGTSTLTKNKK